MAAGDEGGRIVEGGFPARDIGAQMRLTDLQLEAQAVEVHQEAIERGERVFWPDFPQIGGREPRFADDVVELARADVEMQGGTMQNPAPLPPAPMRLDQQGFARERPGREQIFIGLLGSTVSSLRAHSRVRRTSRL